MNNARGHYFLFMLVDTIHIIGKFAIFAGNEKKWGVKIR